MVLIVLTLILSLTLMLVICRVLVRKRMELESTNHVLIGILKLSDLNIISK